jgi:hypothetical protein
MESPYKQFNKVALITLPTNMDDKTLLSFCKINKYFNSKICSDNDFWKRRLNKKIFSLN